MGYCSIRIRPEMCYGERVCPDAQEKHDRPKAHCDRMDHAPVTYNVRICPERFPRLFIALGIVSQGALKIVLNADMHQSIGRLS